MAVKSRKAPATISPFALLMLLALALILTPLLKPLRNWWGDLLQPVSGWMYQLGVASSPFRPKESGSASDLVRLQSELSTLNSENEALRRQLNFTPPAETRSIGADITGQSSEPFARRLRINRGKHDGVVADAAVVADGYLVGKISRVEESFSEVQLITDPGFRITVVVGQSMLPGLAAGSLGGMVIKRIPVTEAVNAHDNVFTSNVGGQVPAGLAIGVVRKVTSSDNVFHDITVETPVALESLRVVMVVLP